MASRNFKTGQKSGNQGARIKTAPGPRTAKNENKNSKEQTNRAISTSKQVDNSKKHTFGSHRHTNEGDEEKRYENHPSFPLNQRKSQNESFSHNVENHSFQQKGTDNYQAERSQMKTNAGNSRYLPLNARGNSHALRSNIQSSGITSSQKHEVVVQRTVVMHETLRKVNERRDFHSHNQHFIPAHKQHSENVIRRQTSQEPQSQKASFAKAVFLQNRSRMKSELHQTDRRANHQAQKYNSQDLDRGSNSQPPFSNKRLQRFHAEDSKHSQFIKIGSVTNVNERNMNLQQTEFQPRNRFPNRHPVAVQTTQSMNSSHNIGRNKPLATSLKNNTAFNKFLHRKHFPYKYPDPVQYNRNTNSSQNTGNSMSFMLKKKSFHKQTSLSEIEHKTHFPHIDSDIPHCSRNMDSSKNIRSKPLEVSEIGNKQNMNLSMKNIGRKKRVHNTRQQPCLLNFNTSVNTRNKTESRSSIPWETEEDDENDDVSIISATSYTEEDNSDSDTERMHSGSGFAVVQADSSSNVNELSGILSEEQHHLDRYNFAEIELKHKTTTLTSKKEESHISVYWDIENCAVPKTKSAVDLVKKIRDTFYDNHIEDDFMVACDTRLLNSVIERELTETLVTVIHSNSESKNAADKKLQMFLDRFAHKYEGTNSAIVLVSGDSDFAPKLNEMRYRYRIFINLIYNSNTRKALKAASDRSILFEDFVQELPDRGEDEIEQPYLIASNLPKHFSPKEVKKALGNLILSINGRVCNISSNTAELKFPDKCAADKALKKLQGTSLSGSTINVAYKVRKYVEFSKSNDKLDSHSESSTEINTKEKKKKNVAKKIKPLDENVKPVSDGNTAGLLNPSGTLTQLQGISSSLQVYVNTRLEDKEYWLLYFSQLWLSKGISAKVVESENNGMYFINFESVSKAQKAKKIFQKQQEIDPSGPKLLQIIKGDNILDNMKNAIKQDQQEIEMKKVDKFLNIVKKRKDHSLKYHEKKMSEAQALVSSVGAKDELNLEEKQAVQHKLDELKEQKTVFSDFTNKLCQKFMKLEQSYTDNSDAITEDLIKDYGRECSSFLSGLSVYGKKNAIIKAIRQNQVVILCGETGSGKSTQVPQYLWREGFATDGLIICTQPREIAAISIAKHVSSQLGCSVGNTVGYQVGLNAKRSKSTQIMYVTDFALLKLCVTNPDFKDISCIIIDEAHERSLYTDLLLGIIKKCLPKRPSLKVIVTSATINVSVFFNYFQLGNDALLQLPGRTFPIEDVWYNHDDKLGWNYLEKTVNIAYDIFKLEEPGDILAFLVTPAETEKAVELFQDIFKSDKCKSKVITHCLHDKLDLQEQQKVFEKAPDNTRKVVFSTNYAETSITIPGIKYVVDCGMVKEARFDESKNINLFSIDFVNRSSAEQRRGHAGRTQCGKCFRLYSKVNYNEDMAEDMTPEILRVNLGQTILKLMELGVPNPMQFDFVQSPSLESLQNAMKQLVHLGAVNKINTTLTEIGKSMARLPIEPRLSHLVLKGIEEEVGYEAVIIAALATISRIICFLHEGNKKEGDAKKMRFCREESDFFTYFEIYKEWIEVPKAKKSQWCVLNSINGRSMKMVHDLVHELILTLSKELNINLKTKYSADETSGEKIHEVIFKSFSENLCIFSGHRKIGYLSPAIDGELHIHPSSSLCYRGMYNPQFIVHDIVLETFQIFLINITPVSEEIIQKAIASGVLKVNLDAFKRLTLNAYRISPVGEGVIKRGLIGEGGEKLQTLEQKIKESTNNSLSAIDINIDKGEITVFLSACYQEHVEKIIRPIIMESQNYFYQEEQEIFGISDIAMFGAVVGVGAEIKEILLPGEYRDVEVKITGNISLGTIIDELDKCGDICFINEGHDGCIKVTFSEVSSAIYAVNVFRNAEEFTIRSMPKFFLHIDVTPFFKVVINWIRRPYIGLAFISFESPVDIANVFSVLSSSCIDYEGNILKVRKSKSSQDLCIENLPKTANSQKLEKVLKQFLYNVKLKKIALVRIKPFESSAKEIESLKEELSQLLLNYTSSDQLYIDFKIPESKHVMYKAIAYFDNSYDGQIAVNALQGRACIEKNCLELKPTLRTCLYCNLKAFTAVKKQIDDELILLNGNSRDNDYLNIRAKVENEDTVIVTISSNNLTDMISAHEVFDQILKGEQIKCSGDLLLEKLLLDSSSLFFKDLEEAIPEAYIHLNKRSKIVSVFGTQESCTSILNKINTFLEDLSRENSKEIYLASEEYSKGLLKHLVKKYGYDLEELRVVTNLKTIEINTMSHHLTVIGSEKYVDEFQKIIDYMNKELGISTEIIADEDCPVCLGPLDQKYYRLEYCGHAYCKECIIVHLKNPNFPIVCCKEDCSEPFVVADIKWAAKEEKSLFINLCTSSLYDFVANNEVIENCPTPECSMIYRVTEDENRFDCPSCQNSTCTRCCVFYHYGMNCEIYQCSKSDESSLEEWLEGDPENRKFCPSCSSPVEKNGGCNRMACWNCKSHFCWLCEREFPPGMELHDHEPFCKNN